MSHHEAQKIKRKLAPFMSLLLAVACMGLLASCGGGEVDSTAKTTINDEYVAPQNIIKSDDGQYISVGYLNVTKRKNVTDDALIKEVILLGGSVVSGDGNFYKLRFQSINTSQQAYDVVTKLFDAGLISSGAPASLGSTKYALSDAYLTNYSTNGGFPTVDLIGAGDYIEKRGIKLQDVKVAVIDSGFILHNDIKFFERRSPSLIVDTSDNLGGTTADLSTYDSEPFLNPWWADLDNFKWFYDPVESPNHGMHVAGIIGATPNSIGTSGVATILEPDGLKLIGIKADYDWGNIFKSISKMASLGVKVFNLSINGTVVGLSDNAKNMHRRNILTSLAIAFANGDFLLVVAAGNEKSNARDAYLSLIFDDSNSSDLIKLNQELVSDYGVSVGDIRNRVIIVGASSQDSGQTKLATYSNFGNAVEMYATGGSGGVNGVGCNSSDKRYLIYSLSAKGNTNYWGTCGTSMASPFVAGSAALLYRINPSLSAARVKELLIESSYIFSVNGTDAKHLQIQNAVAKTIDTLTKPTVSITATPSAVKLGEQVTFTANVTNTPNGAIKSYAWKFGDGGTSSAATQQYTYSTANTYTVELTITDAKGVTATATLPVTVSPATPVPTVTGITAPPTLTAGVNATFSINGSNLPTGENLVVTTSGVGCTGFGYGTRSATAHTFACTPSSAGSLSFAVSTASGKSLGTFPATPFTVASATPPNSEINYTLVYPTEYNSLLAYWIPSNITKAQLSYSYQNNNDWATEISTGSFNLDKRHIKFNILSGTCRVNIVVSTEAGLMQFTGDNIKLVNIPSTSIYPLGVGSYSIDFGADPTPSMTWNIMKDDFPLSIGTVGSIGDVQDRLVDSTYGAKYSMKMVVRDGCRINGFSIQ